MNIADTVSKGADAVGSAAGKTADTVKRRPAETSTLVAAAIVKVFVSLFGNVIPKLDDPDMVANLIILVGALPVGITWLTERLKK